MADGTKISRAAKISRDATEVAKKGKQKKSGSSARKQKKPEFNDIANKTYDRERRKLLGITENISKQSETHADSINEKIKNVKRMKDKNNKRDERLQEELDSILAKISLELEKGHSAGKSP